MLDLYFCSRVARRLKNGRDAVVLTGFLEYLHRRGHTRHTVHHYMRAAELFLNWLRRRRRLLAEMDEAMIWQFACRRRSSRAGRHTTRAALRQLLRHCGGARQSVRQAAGRKPALERTVTEYDAHLDNACGLAPATRQYRRRYALEFLRFVFGARPLDWRHIRPDVVHDFVARYGTTGRIAAAQVAAISLRSSLRWLQFQGRVDARVVAAVPHFARWRLASLPTVMSPEQLRLFLMSFDRSHPTGRRDYAMALCMVDLGLRVAEVAALQIGDLDATAGTLHLSSGKPRRDRVLPMPRRVSEAVVAYVRRDRPQTDDLGLFLRHRAPIGVAVTRELVRWVMRRAYAVVPGCEQWTGTHLLRHTAASRLQNAGANLKQVADILGHRSLDTTMVYTKVDLDRLVEVALPWPHWKEARS